MMSPFQSSGEFPGQSPKHSPLLVTESAPLGVAVVGTGFGQKVHIPGFQIHPRTQVVAIYHRDRTKARAIATAQDIPHACDNFQDILALPEVQAVSISTPPALHYPMAKAALEAGKSVLLEKPTALTGAEARELYQLATHRGIATCLDFEYRCVPAWQYLAERLETVGQKRLIRIDWLMQSRADAQRPWNWYARKEEGGGALGALGSHTFDYIAWLFGPVQRLCARLTTTIRERPDPVSGTLKAVDGDDTALILAELADGTPCHIAISSVTYQGRGHWVEVYGDRATLVLGSDNQKDYVHGFRLWEAPVGHDLKEVDIPARLAFAQNYPDGRLAPFIRIVDRWVQGIEQGKALAPTLREGVYSQLLMDCVHQSHVQNTWVDVPALDSFLAVVSEPSTHEYTTP